MAAWGVGRSVAGCLLGPVVRWPGVARTFLTPPRVRYLLVPPPKTEERIRKFETEHGSGQGSKVIRAPCTNPVWFSVGKTDCEMRPGHVLTRLLRAITELERELGSNAEPVKSGSDFKIKVNGIVTAYTTFRGDGRWILAGSNRYAENKRQMVAAYAELS
jgi:hypothetical protein